MGVKLMTGATGEQDIQAADDRECLAGITGLDSYVFPTGNQLKATLVDANTVTIGTGAGSLQGSRFRCSTTTAVNIQSGTQGQFRHDVIGLHFSRETSGREGLEFQVLTGEPAASEGAAADPAYTAGDLLKGDAEAFMPLYRVKLSGINAADPEPLFSVLTPLATLGDFVSHNVFAISTTSAGSPLTITPNRDCSIYVRAILQGVHGYAGSKCSCGISCDKLSASWMCLALISGGDQVDRPMITEAIFNGAKAGVVYTFTRTDTGNLQIAGGRKMLAVCI